MNKLKLLNCPFCGGEARLYGNSKLIGTKLKHYQVAVCTNDDCGCRTSHCETVEEAIYRWNTRKPMSNIVEKLEKLPYGRSYHDYAEKGIVHKYLERNDVLDIVKQEINNGLE